MAFHMMTYFARVIYSEQKANRDKNGGREKWEEKKPRTGMLGPGYRLLNVREICKNTTAYQFGGYELFMTDCGRAMPNNIRG